MVARNSGRARRPGTPAYEKACSQR
jgi:hypothetical protein